MEALQAHSDAQRVGKGRYIVCSAAGCSFCIGVTNTMMTLVTAGLGGRWFLEGPFYYKAISGTPTIQPWPDVAISEGGFGSAGAAPGSKTTSVPGS